MINDQNLPRVCLKGAGKKFNLNLIKREGALFRCLKFFSRSKVKKEFWALRNIDFCPTDGKIVGIIGKNGSGKSTLLRLIAGIYEPSEGEVSVNGEMIYLTGFGQGLMPKLTMRENIYLVGALLGLSFKEVENKFGEIVEFSGLGDYVDVRVYKFSSGMISRLSFSTTIFCVKHKNPEIILIDEALDAGADLSFHNKALNKIEELIMGGANVVLVSHNLETIPRYCQEVLWMESGQIIRQGNPQEIIMEYIKAN